jgi:hypothetical protein
MVNLRMVDVRNGDRQSIGQHATSPFCRLVCITGLTIEKVSLKAHAFGRAGFMSRAVRVQLVGRMRALGEAYGVN